MQDLQAANSSSSSWAGRGVMQKERMGRGSSAALAGMVMGGRGLRACDSCGRERAQWFCEADEAFLCEGCDASVHAANAVAKRHERVLLASGTASTVKQPLPIPTDRCFKVSWAHYGSTKRPRTRRQNRVRRNQSHQTDKALFPQPFDAHSRFAPSSAGFPFNIKPEPLSPSLISCHFDEDDLHVPDHSHLFDSLFENSLLHQQHHQVPTYTPADHQLHPSSPTIDCVDHKSLPPSPGDRAQEQADRSSEFLIPGNCINLEHFLDAASSDNSSSDKMLSSDCNADDDPFTERAYFHHADVFYNNHVSFDDDHKLSAEDGAEGAALYSFTVPVMNYPRGAEDEPTAGFIGDEWRQAHTTTEEVQIPCNWLCEEKTETHSGINERIRFSQMLGADAYECEPEYKANLGLKLDMEDVLAAWSNQAPVWVDGEQAPEVNILLNTIVLNASWNDMHTYQAIAAGLAAAGLSDVATPKTGAAREAVVMRYREKRRNRLFSKKIRYEVRKLNAEKRPRMKGRFVKRTANVG